MEKSIPIEEFNIKEKLNRALRRAKEIHIECIDKKRDKKIELLEQRSLDNIANTMTYYNDCYAPCIMDFAYILNRIKNESVIDNCEESLQVKIDIAEQLSKMKKVPSPNTECHIESKYLDKCTSFKSYIMKKFFNQRKYKIIFHNKIATYDNIFYEKRKKFNSLNLLIFTEVIIFLLATIFQIVWLFVISMFSTIATFAAIVFVKCILGNGNL